MEYPVAAREHVEVKVLKSVQENAFQEELINFFKDSNPTNPKPLKKESKLSQLEPFGQREDA